MYHTSQLYHMLHPFPISQVFLMHPMCLMHHPFPISQVYLSPPVYRMNQFLASLSVLEPDMTVLAYVLEVLRRFTQVFLR